ncbi:aldehyde dehydrogenase [Conexibacter sp. SYSU D00693]|uniref:aldehyde dehydrogenase family protein n=1 Tax=Conexibacter sp. SYSU D00693 TaxID=2812560 RepID=UPI00196B518D|nr:aldehyde dehydrogenase family protein [Conexibacter sp. SYSU D00693]
MSAVTATVHHATAASSATIERRDPATGEVLGTIPAGDAETVHEAVLAARAAQGPWARTAPGDRAGHLKAAARRLREHAEELAELQTREMGKPLADSRGGVDAGIGAIEQYAELGPLHRGASLQGGWLATDAMVHEPYGVVALLVPWNDPVAIACGQVAAALVTGNAVVLKPSERSPFSAQRLHELLCEDLPEGVLQLVLGDARAGRPLAAHADVDVVLHTGSVATGREVAEVCARRGAKALLELGGKDPLLVDAGVDPQWAAEQCAAGAFANAGQVCTSVERVYVHREVAGAFVDALVGEARAHRPGPGMDPQTTLGPLVDDVQLGLVADQVREAVEAGATVRCGGERLDRDGSFYAATVVTDVPDDARLMQEETFGPVAAVRVVEDFDEALRLATTTPYGLAATVLTCDQGHAARAVRELDAGTVKVNAAWGGAPGGAAQPRRASGQGFGYGPELLDELTLTKVVHLEPGVPARA